MSIKPVIKSVIQPVIQPIIYGSLALLSYLLSTQFYGQGEKILYSIGLWGLALFFSGGFVSSLINALFYGRK